MTFDEMRLNAYKNTGVKNKVSPQDSVVEKILNDERKNELSAATNALKNGGLIKVGDAPKESEKKDSLYRRVAKFLVLVGVDEAAKILPHLSKEQTEKIIPEIATIRSVDKDEAVEIIKEFESLVQKSRENGGVETARTILEKAFGAKKADELLERSVPFKDGKPFEYLMEADSDKVGLLLKNESVPVMAMVLSQLKPKVSAQVIQAMDAGTKKDVVIRLAKMQKIDHEILKNVDQKMQEKFNSLNVEKSDSIEGKNILAQILKKMSPESEEKILNCLSEQDPDLGVDLRERLFTIDDIVNSDDKFIQLQLRQMSDMDCALLIADKNDELRSKILQNVSSNRAKEILDAENFNKPMKRADVEKVTSQFFSVLRRAWEDGKLIIKGRDDEIYV